ncbi:MAG: c-type cytochrome [Saprospiraceae bacterium]|nr:c-type cytochrome [Saprospiraceae bacterium]MBK7220645.1 c-type cytochrome [Saprospiraceae bacterium]MBK7790726.1 c-type cytochrome [Saprospiraceae bacterium]MBK8111395.1 c-type cytochrome [Saprospiraceae bacterium]MBK9689369.1 c-type cytochrome [Saprospiraceae bacterium]
MVVKKWLIPTAWLCFALFYVVSCKEEVTQKNSGTVVTAEKSPADVVAHGKYLVEIMGCHDCHSPKRMGAKGPELIPELILSGYPSDRPIVKMDSKLLKQGFAMLYPDLTAGAGPWGMSFAGNLTPDESGIGSWTRDQFKKALTEGKLKGLDTGRTLLPTMPWVNFKSLKEDDITAIYEYLKSVKPVKNVVPSPIPPDQI